MWNMKNSSDNFSYASVDVGWGKAETSIEPSGGVTALIHLD